MDQFSRTELLLGKQAMEKLKNARGAVFGLGGVGGYAVEALARSGVGQLELIDHDDISLTNLNRQILATQDTLGMPKAEAAAQRAKAINPHIQAVARQVFYTPETAHQFDFSRYDYVVDAIDTVTGKLMLIKAAKEANTPIISSMGTGNKLDATAFRVADIYDTSVCPLARVMRTQLKKRGIEKHRVVYSKEPPMKPLEDIVDNGRHLPGSLSFVPPVMGMILAGEVIRDLCGKK